MLPCLNVTMQESLIVGLPKLMQKLQEIPRLEEEIGDNGTPGSLIDINSIVSFGGTATRENLNGDWHTEMNAPHYRIGRLLIALILDNFT